VEYYSIVFTKTDTACCQPLSATSLSEMNAAHHLLHRHRFG
jgi:hypothetical protein